MRLQSPTHATIPFQPDQSGLRRLMAAILVDAVAVLRASVRTRGDQTLKRETIHWVMAEDAEWPFSFVRVCEALEYDPVSVRLRMIRLIARRTQARPRVTTLRLAS